MFKKITNIALYKSFVILRIILREVFPKIIAKILILSLALITFIFGIHTDIFSSYDKYSNHSELQYNWFNIEDILNFPKEQFAINYKKSYPITNISLNDEERIKKKSRKFTIILDKTGSLVPDEIEKEYQDRIKKELNKNLKKKSKELSSVESLDLNIEDLFLLTSLYRVSQDFSSYEKTQVQIIIYEGYGEKIKNDKKTITNDKLVVNIEFSDKNKYSNKNILDTAYKDILYSLENIDKDLVNSRDTNFYDFIKELNDKQYINDGDFDHSSLIFLSDFYHEVPNSEEIFYQIGNELEKLKRYYNQVNLISFRNSNQASLKISRKIKDLFRDNFNDIYFYEFEKYLKENIPSEDQINHMFSSTIDHKKPITLYHSYDSISYKHDYIGGISFQDTIKGDYLMIGYGNRLKPKIFVSKYNYLKLKNRRDNFECKLYPFSVTKINSREIYNVSLFTDDYDNKNSFLEIHYPNTTNIIRKPIILKPILPITACVYLILLYFISSISIILVPIYCLFSLKKYNKISNKRDFWTPIIILSFLTIYFIYYLSSSIENFYLIYQTEIGNIHYLIIPFILFILFLFLYSLRKSLDKFNKKITRKNQNSIR